jgi:hypothetical protein
MLAERHVGRQKVGNVCAPMQGELTDISVIDIMSIDGLQVHVE